MDIKQLLITTGILGILVFGMINFIITTQSDNNAEYPIINNSLINSTYGELSGNISSSQSKAQASSDTFGNITPTQQFGELEITSIISPTRTVKTILLGLWNIYVKLPIIILGVDEAVAGLISSILLIIIIIGIWAVWKGVVS